MLLLIISLFSHYDLLNCDKDENGYYSVPHRAITLPMFSFSITPSRVADPGRKNLKSAIPVTTPPRFLSDYKRPIHPPPTGSLHTFQKVDRLMISYPSLIYIPRPVVSRSGSKLDLIPPRSASTFSISTKFSTLGEYGKIWLHEMSQHYTSNKWLMTGGIIEYTTEQYSPDNGPNSSKVLDRYKQLKNNSKCLSRPDHQKKDPGLASQEKQLFLKDKHGGNTPEKDKNLRITMLGRSPVYTPPDRDSTTPTTAGDVFIGNIKTDPMPTPPRKQRYYDMMELYDEGYMMIFLIELSRLIAMKDAKDVRDVLIHTEPIITNLFQQGRLAWFGRPLLDITLEISIALSEGQIDVLQSYGAMMHHFLLQRKQELSTEVNSIIDYADLLYNIDEGELLFDTLVEFEDYPNTIKTGYFLCDSIITNLLRPFRRLKNTDRLQRLLDSINAALKKRFDQYPGRANEESQQYAEGQKHQPRAQSRSHSHTSRSPARKKKSQRIRYHERNRDRKRPRRVLYRPELGGGNILYYRRQRSQKVNEYPSFQKRFKVVTSKYHFQPTNTQTTDVLNLTTQPISGNSSGENRDLYETVTPFPFHENHDAMDMESYKKHIQPLYGQNEPGRDKSPVRTVRKDNTSINDQVNDHLKGTEYQKKATTERQLKAELLRKIVEGSSYSDEEESLKNHLIKALQHETKNFRNTTTNNNYNITTN